jgi:hypothetical protein
MPVSMQTLTSLPSPEIHRGLLQAKWPSSIALRCFPSRENFAAKANALFHLPWVIKSCSWLNFVCMVFTPFVCVYYTHQAALDYKEKP